jgi:hypothetical protein
MSLKLLATVQPLTSAPSRGGGYLRQGYYRADYSQLAHWDRGPAKVKLAPSLWTWLQKLY